MWMKHVYKPGRRGNLFLAGKYKVRFPLISVVGKSNNVEFVIDWKRPQNGDDSRLGLH